MKSPIDLFFKLGDKVTKGDMKRKSDFDYYFMWIMFLAFCSVLVGNGINFYKTHQLQYLGWALVMVAILWFQYFALKGVREIRKIQNQFSQKIEVKPIKEDKISDMIGEFDENKGN